MLLLLELSRHSLTHNTNLENLTAHEGARHIGTYPSEAPEEMRTCCCWKRTLVTLLVVADKLEADLRTVGDMPLLGTEGMMGKASALL